MKKIINPCQSRKSPQVSLLNADSTNNNACHLYDLIVDSKLDALFLTETKQLIDVSPLFEAATPLTNKLHHIVRPRAVSGHPGSGLGVIVRRKIHNVKYSCGKIKNFGCMEIHFTCASHKIVEH